MNKCINVWASAGQGAWEPGWESEGRGSVAWEGRGEGKSHACVSAFSLLIMICYGLAAKSIQTFHFTPFSLRMEVKENVYPRED